MQPKNRPMHPKAEQIGIAVIGRSLNPNPRFPLDFRNPETVGDTFIRLCSRLPTNVTDDELEAETTRRWPGLLREANRQDVYYRRHRSLDALLNDGGK